MSLPEVAATGLHRTAEGGVVAAIAVAESHSTEPLAPASWELEEVAGEPARSARDSARVFAIVTSIHDSEQYPLYHMEKNDIT